MNTFTALIADCAVTEMSVASPFLASRDYLGDPDNPRSGRWSRCKVEGPRESAKATLVGTSQCPSYHCG